MKWISHCSRNPMWNVPPWAKYNWIIPWAAWSLLVSPPVRGLGDDWWTLQKCCSSTILLYSLDNCSSRDMEILLDQRIQLNMSPGLECTHWGRPPVPESHKVFHHMEKMEITGGRELSLRMCLNLDWNHPRNFDISWVGEGCFSEK